MGGVVLAQTINDLPLNGRNYVFLAQLNAGVIQAQQDTRGIAGNGNFSANGQPSFTNNYLLDGVDNNSNLVDFINPDMVVLGGGLSSIARSAFSARWRTSSSSTISC